MNKSLILILSTVGFLIQNPIRATTKLDFTTVDQLTYRYFMEKNWDSVITIGKQALRQDIDYYYLRVRMGIAYFEKTEYIPAATHLKKARKFNSSDAVIVNYLYQALQYSNRTDEALAIKSLLPHDAQDNRSFKAEDLLMDVRAFGGYTLSSNRSPDNLDDLTGPDSIYGEQDLYGNSMYAHLGLKINVFNKASISMSYNYLNFNKTRYYQYGRAEAQLDTIIDNPFSRDYFYSYPWKIHDTAILYNVVQHEGYLGGAIMIPGNIKVSPAVHLVHLNYPLMIQSMTDSVSDTAYFLKADSSYHMFNYPSAVYNFKLSDTSFTNWVISLGLAKDIGNFTVELTGSWSNLNGKKQKQLGVSLSYFPFGTLDFYGTTTLSGFWQQQDKRFLAGQMLGVKITPWLWGEADFLYGDLTNANIHNGSIVYNNSDIIKYRAGASLLIAAGNHLRFSLVYQYLRKESSQLFYVKNEDPETREVIEIPQIKNNPYSTNTLILGITWKL